MTLYESALTAVLPWNSVDASDDTSDFENLPQQSIDICLMCEHCADACEYCGDWNTSSSGRPRARIDYALLREMMKLKLCNRACCAALGVSERTLQRTKKRIRLEELF